MVAIIRKRTPKEIPPRRSRSWSQLYWAGGASVLIALLLYIVALVLDFTLPAVPTSGGAAVLTYIGAHRAAYIAEQVLWLAPGILLAVVVLAVYIAIKDLNPSWALIGGVLAVASWVITPAYPTTGAGAPALVHLSDKYMATGDAAQRAALAAAAEGFIAQNAIASVIGVLEAIGILIISVVMLRGTFKRSVVYLGIATGGTGIVCEALKTVVGVGYIVYGLLLFVWLAAIGWTLFQLARGRPGEGHRQVAPQH